METLFLPGRYAERTETFTVGQSDADARGRLRVRALCNYLEETAGLHAEELGAGFAHLQSLGITWVLCRLVMRMENYPAAGELFRVQTWPNQAERVQCRRDFFWRDSQGGLLGRAASYWVIANRRTRRLERLPDFVRSFFPDAPFYALEDARERVPALASESEGARAGAPLARIQVCRSDIDGNEHVNNVRYLDWVLESVPASVRAAATLRELILDFRAEALLDDTVAVRAEPDGTNAFLHGIFREQDGRALARARTVWTAP